MSDTHIYTTNSEFGHYEVVDTMYNNRPARVLYSGHGLTAQSGVALDQNPELLFDYNQRFIELIRGLRPKRVLLIGGGTFTLPTALISEFPAIHLEVAELDPILLQIGEQYFNFAAGKHTSVHIMDGKQYLLQSAEQFDLILLDAFFESTIPHVFQTNDTATLFANHLRAGGIIAANIIASYYGVRSRTLRLQIAAFRSAFSNLQLFPAGYEPSLWMPQNFILTAQNGRRELQPYLRYSQLPLPGNTGDILRH